MIDRQAAFGHELFEVTEAQGEAKIPANAHHNHGRSKLTFTEE
jgi:hypothetical protein